MSFSQVNSEFISKSSQWTKFCNYIYRAVRSWFIFVYNKQPKVFTAPTSSIPCDKSYNLISVASSKKVSYLSCREYRGYDAWLACDPWFRPQYLKRSWSCSRSDLWAEQQENPKYKHGYGPKSSQKFLF